MRGYPENRFSDSAASYRGGELRLTARANPLGKISWLKFADINRLQFVIFGEAGRVADGYLVEKFARDLNWEAGLGCRIMAPKAVSRLDMGVSDEAGAV